MIRKEKLEEIRDKIIIFLLKAIKRFIIFIINIDYLRLSMLVTIPLSIVTSIMCIYYFTHYGFELSILICMLSCWLVMICTCYIFRYENYDEEYEDEEDK